MVVPMLAAEIPNIENGGVAADGLSVTWKLKTGVQWHDGRPFTADDVVFNWEYGSAENRSAVRAAPRSLRWTMAWRCAPSAQLAPWCRAGRW
jgi:ABC-type transport system substrate-binding protein